MIKANSSKPFGQSLIEFALILPLLLMFAFFILDFGRAVYYYSVIHNAAREGARFGVQSIYLNDLYDVDGDPVDLSQTSQDAIDAYAQQYIYGLPTVIITSDIEFGTNNTIIYLLVTARCQYVPVTPFLSTIIGGGIWLESTSRMRIEPRIHFMKNDINLFYMEKIQ